MKLNLDKFVVSRSCLLYISFIHSFMIWYDMIRLVCHLKNEIQNPSNSNLDTWPLLLLVRHKVLHSGVVGGEWKIAKNKIFFFEFFVFFFIHSFLCRKQIKIFFFLFIQNILTFTIDYELCVCVCMFAIPIRFATNHCIKRNRTKKKHWTKNLTFTEINKSRRNLNFGNQMKK